jgi:hypothetical protein
MFTKTEKVNLIQFNERKTKAHEKRHKDTDNFLVTVGYFVP